MKEKYYHALHYSNFFALVPSVVSCVLMIAYEIDVFRKFNIFKSFDFAEIKFKWL